MEHKKWYDHAGQVTTALGPGFSLVAIGAEFPTTSQTTSIPVSHHWVFEVTGAGAHTFYLHVDVTSLSGFFSASFPHLSLLYFPTAYGTVEPLTAAVSNAGDDRGLQLARPSPLEIVADGAQPEAFNAAGA